MVAITLGGTAATGGERNGSSDLLLAQALTKPERAQPTAKPAPAARTAQMTLGGHPVTAMLLGAPGSNGKTLYEVQWRGVSVQTALTGQIGPAQFKPGSPLKRQLEQAFRASQAQAATPGSRPAARTVQLQLGGHPVTAMPLGAPNARGQTLYEVQWRGVSVQTALTGQIGPAQFKPGSPLKRQLEQAFQASQPQSGFVPAFLAGVEGLKGAGAALAGRTGLINPADAERTVQGTNRRAQQIFKPTEQWGPTKLAELVGGSVPYMAAPLAAAGAVATLPVSGTAATVVGLGAAGMASLAQFTGTNLTRQMDEGKSLAKTDLGKAALAAVPMAMLDTLSLKMMPGVGRLLGNAGVKVTQGTAQQLSRQILVKAAIDYTAATGRTMTAEGLTEASQQGFERLQAGLSITDANARKEYFDALVGGALLGGAIAPVGRAMERGTAARPRQQGQAHAPRATRTQPALQTGPRPPINPPALPPGPPPANASGRGASLPAAVDSPTVGDAINLSQLSLPQAMAYSRTQPVGLRFVWRGVDESGDPVARQLSGQGAPPPPIDKSRWSHYYAQTADKGPRRLLKDTLADIAASGEPGGVALDLGAGAGAATQHLLEAGYEVLAIDPDPASAQHLLQHTPPSRIDRLRPLTQSLQQADLPPARVVWAGVSLPYVPAQDFDAVWRKIDDAMQPGGWFAGDFFGPRDATTQGPGGRTAVSREQIERMFANYDIVQLDEREGPTTLSGGTVIHSHTYHIRARKRTGGGDAETSPVRDAGPRGVGTARPGDSPAQDVSLLVERELVSAQRSGRLEGFPARMASAILATAKPDEVWPAIGALVMRGGTHAMVGYELREQSGYDIVDPVLGDMFRSPAEQASPQPTQQPNQASSHPPAEVSTQGVRFGGRPLLGADQPNAPLANRSRAQLTQELGPSASAKLLEAGALGLRGEQGILTLGQSLHEALGGQPLLPQQLLRVAAVLNELDTEPGAQESFPLALHDLEHLAGRAGKGGGVYPTTLRGENLIDAVGSYPSRQYDWAHDVADAIRQGAPLGAQPGLARPFGMNLFDHQAMRYRLNQLQVLFEGQVLPWVSTRSEGMLDAWARLHAVGASLALVPGMDLRGLEQSDASWSELVRRGPGVERIDLAVVYPEVHEFLLRELRSMRQRPAAGGTTAIPAEPFAKSSRFERLHGALFPANAPAGLKDALLRSLQRRAFPGTDAPVSGLQDPASRNQALHAAARAIALDPGFFMVGGTVRTDLALEAFQGWLSQAAKANPGMVIGGAPLGTQDVNGIVARLRQSDDPQAAMRRLLGQPGLAAQLNSPLDFHAEPALGGAAGAPRGATPADTGAAVPSGVNSGTEMASPQLDPLRDALRGLVQHAMAERYSAADPAGRQRLMHLLAQQSVQDTFDAWLPLPGAAPGLPSLPVRLTVRRQAPESGDRLLVNAGWGELTDRIRQPVERHFAAQGIEGWKSLSVDDAVLLGNGRLLEPGQRAAPGGAWPADPWGPGGLPNLSAHIGIPPALWDMTLTRSQFAAVVDRLGLEQPGLHPSWQPSQGQRRLLMNLFEHREKLADLLGTRYLSRDEAAAELVRTLEHMDRATPGMFPVEMNFQVEPRSPDGSNWGIGIGAIGRDRSVRPFVVNDEFTNRTPEALAGYRLHVHPTEQASMAMPRGVQLPAFVTRPPAAQQEVRRLLGLSLGDLVSALGHGQSSMVYDNGAAIRLKPTQAWFDLGLSTQIALIEELVSFQNEGPRRSARQPVAQFMADNADSMKRLRELLERLPVTFEILANGPWPSKTAALSRDGIDLTPTTKILAKPSGSSGRAPGLPPR